MKIVLLIVAVWLAAWMQVSGFGHFRPLGIIPNLVLVVVVIQALWRNATPALAAALGGGLLLDIAAGDPNFGLRMAFYVTTALAIIAGRQFGLQVDSVFAGVAVVMLASLTYDVVVLATIGFPLDWSVASRIGRELVVNGSLVALAYLVRANLGQRMTVSGEPTLRFKQ